MVSMAPRNVIMQTDKEPSATDGMVVESDSLPSAEVAEPSKRRPVQIVWRNVIVMTLLHLGAVYALILVPQSHPLTWLWSKFEILNVSLST